MPIVGAYCGHLERHDGIEPRAKLGLRITSPSDRPGQILLSNAAPAEQRSFSPLVGPQMIELSRQWPKARSARPGWNASHR